MIGALFEVYNELEPRFRKLIFDNLRKSIPENPAYLWPLLVAGRGAQPQRAQGLTGADAGAVVTGVTSWGPERGIEFTGAGLGLVRCVGAWA